MRTLVSLLLLVFFFSLTPTLSYAIATVTSSGIISVDWNQDSGAFIWGTSVFGGNGADAIWGTENYTLEDGNRVYDQHVKDYGGPGWVDTIDDVTYTSSASFGTIVVGEASTAERSVFSSAEVTNDGVGLTLNASGTSHLVRGFTLSTGEGFSFDANYIFYDTVDLDDPETETADWYHHANLLLSYYSVSDAEWVELDEQKIAFNRSNPLSDEGELSVIDPEGWDTDRLYSIELHTYNSASGYSPVNEVAPVPEPATFILLGSGLAGLAFYRRKRK